MTGDVTPRMKTTRGKRGKGKERKAAFKTIRLSVEARSHGHCEARLVGCDERGEHVHHILMRSQGGSDDLTNLLMCCRVCHDSIHRNPALSYSMGLLKRSSA